MDEFLNSIPLDTILKKVFKIMPTETNLEQINQIEIFDTNGYHLVLPADNVEIQEIKILDNGKTLRIIYKPKITNENL